MTKKIINLFLLIFISFSAYAESTFHLIVVYDSQDTDIWAVTDKDNLVKNCTKYANLSGLTFKGTVYKQHEVSKSTLQSKIRNLNVGSDDVIWFAYSGHGKNASTSTYTKFPKIKLGSTDKMTQDELHRLIKSKGARLTLSTFDCCNYTKRQIVDRSIKPFSGKNPLGYIKLFKKGKADIKATAIKDGYLADGFAIGTKEFGGLFTYSFVESIDLVCNSAENIDNITWKNIIAKAKTKTNKLANSIRRTQIPYIQLNNEEYGVLVTPVAPECIEVEEGETKEFILGLILDNFKMDKKNKGKEISITIDDLKTCDGELIGSRELIVGEEIQLDGYK
jgi:hypothetical protein